MSTNNNNNNALSLFTQDRSAANNDIKEINSWDAGSIENFPWLFVGSLSAAESHEHLLANKITRILTVARRLPVIPPPKGIDHIIVEIDDHPRANFLDIVPQCRNILNAAASDAASECGCILVHCASGVSRSVAAVVSWLMLPERGFTMEEALNAVRTNRSQANPNIGFQCQLQVLEKHRGNIAMAVAEWSVNTREDILERAANRRQIANEIHAAVDELEVNIQKHRSFVFSGSGQDSSKNDAVGNASKLMCTASQLSDRIDACKADTDGLPEDRVAKIVLKSARSKLERLIGALEDSSS